ncbi:MAG: cytochrome P450, partial [Myxococcota bacterium]
MVWRTQQEDRLWAQLELDHARTVFLDRDGVFSKGGRWKTLKMLLGEGMLTSDGEPWRRKRRVVEPAFHRSQLSQLTTMMADTTETMVDAWRAHARRDAPINVAPWMMELALEIVVRALFSSDISSEVKTISTSFMTAQNYISRITWDPIARVRSHLPSRRRRRFRHAVQTLDRIVFDLLNARRTSETSRGDLLDMILTASGEDVEKPLSDRELRDEVLTLMIAGHETTANALAWTWYMLSTYPDAARAIRTEVNQVLGKRRDIQFGDVQQLHWTRRVVQEVMRLYPPLWFLPRSVERPTRIGDVFVPQGSMVFVSPYVLHHDARYWNNPMGFDPARFQARPKPYTYLPFGMGPRTCIGRSFALMELTLIVALVVRAFDIALVPGQQVVPTTLLTLRPRRGVHVQLKEV